jgi:hypothetical protein
MDMADNKEKNKIITKVASVSLPITPLLKEEKKTETSGAHLHLSSLTISLSNSCFLVAPTFLLKPANQ